MHIINDCMLPQGCKIPSFDDIKMKEGLILCGDEGWILVTHLFMEEGGSHQVVNMDKRQVQNFSWCMYMVYIVLVGSILGGAN